MTIISSRKVRLIALPFQKESLRYPHQMAFSPIFALPFQPLWKNTISQLHSIKLT